jgi:DnaJ-class molecular chaperone
MSKRGTCPTCGGDVSTSADRCPSCGEAEFVDSYLEELPATQCPACNGTGRMDVSDVISPTDLSSLQVTCDKCDGAGSEQHGRRILIDRRTNESRLHSKW